MALDGFKAFNVMALSQNFLFWWRMELLGMLPFSAQGAPPWEAKLRIVWQDDKVEISTPRRSGVAPLSVPLDGTSPETERELLNSAVTDAGYPTDDAVVQIPALRVLKRHLSLPRAAERDLMDVIRNQFDRVMPVPQHRSFFDFRILDRDFRTQLIKVEIRCVLRQDVEQILARIQGWGINVVAIEPLENGSENRIILSKPDSAIGKPRIARVLVGTLAVVNAFLLVGVLSSPVIDKALLESKSRNNVLAVRTRAEMVLKLTRKVEQVEKQVSFLATQRGEIPFAVVVLKELTRVLPNGTWLVGLKLKDNVVELKGNSPQAAALIGKIEQSTMFTNVRFLAPVTQDSKTVTERFRISADLLTSKSPGQ